MPPDTRHMLLLSFYFFLVAPLPKLQTSTAVAQTPRRTVIHSNWLVPGLHSHGPPTKGKLYVTLHPSDSVSIPVSPRSSCHRTAYPFSDRGTLDDRYGAVHKPKHVSAMMAWHCHTQCDGTPATILFKISTATPRPIEPVVATSSKFFIRPRLWDEFFRTR